MRPTRRCFLLTGVCGGLGLTLTACANLRPTTAPGDRAAEFFAAVRRGDDPAVLAALTDDAGLLAARERDGASALTVALLAGRPATAELLRARGYQPDVVECAWLGEWERFAALAKEQPAAVVATHPIGGPAMYAAARGGVGEEIWRVFSAGGVPDPPDRPPTAWSPLRAAFAVADLAVAEMAAANLLANGADANARQPGGSSALHAAAARGSVALVEMLLRKHAAVDARDDDGRTPLDLAEGHAHATVARMLREHAAVRRDHLALRRAFTVDGQPYRPRPVDEVPPAEQWRFVGMGHGDLRGIQDGLAAHPNLVHAHATTTEMAVEAATHVGNRRICEVLLAHGAPYSLPAAVLCGTADAVAELLRQAPDRIHERGAHDFPLLWYPVLAGGSLELAATLMDHGADIETQHFLGTTALHLAAARGQREMVALLLDRGADPDRVGRKFEARGETPRQLALAGGHTAVARLLEDRGAARR